MPPSARRTPGVEVGFVTRSHFKSAEAHHRAGRLEEATRAYQDCLREHPDDVAALGGLGRLYQQQGLHADASPLIERAVARQPGSAALRVQWARSLRALGRSDAALDALYEATRLAPRDAGAHQELGNLLKHLGHASEAV
ncbi:MAG: tetratricopeptide repeat protein, partial [Deltaproteobacteria bacterium]